MPEICYPICMADDAMVTIPAGSLRALERKVESFKTLVEISTIISSTLDLEELMSLVMEKAKGVMGAEACSILFYNRDMQKLEFEVAVCEEGDASNILKKKVLLDIGQGIAGWVAEHLEPLVIEDVKKDPRFFQGADKMTGFETKGLIAVPLIGRRGLIGVAEMVNPGRFDFDMEIFRLLCRQFAIAIENSFAHKESLERERLRQELDIAAALQRSFLPESPTFSLGDLSVSAVNISAAKVGGDIYDFVTPAEGKLGVLIGDVSGKGVSAALYMAKASSDFRYISSRAESPGAVLDGLNAALSRYPRGMFLTALYLIADSAKGEALIACAGHPPCIRITAEEVRVLSVASGPPLGIVPASYETTSITLGRGERLILLTDGVFDAKDRSGGRLGFEQVVEFIRRHRDEEDIVRMIVDRVSDFSEGTEWADDLTVVEVRRR